MLPIEFYWLAEATEEFLDNDQLQYETYLEMVTKLGLLTSKQLATMTLQQIKDYLMDIGIQNFRRLSGKPVYVFNERYFPTMYVDYNEISNHIVAESTSEQDRLVDKYYIVDHTLDGIDSLYLEQYYWGLNTNIYLYSEIEMNAVLKLAVSKHPSLANVSLLPTEED